MVKKLVQIRIGSDIYFLLVGTQFYLWQLFVDLFAKITRLVIRESAYGWLRILHITIFEKYSLVGSANLLLCRKVASTRAFPHPSSAAPKQNTGQNLDRK
ncbi:hypothetical protein [Arenicella chitinivorans]|uniref:hypothetical protein n=1 Tax=Arenicella chitinivorans TaxID=1329800 RepID=UPI00167B4F8F|nr:hypothetical protein [Arenicella chitinivorans]